MNIIKRKEFEELPRPLTGIYGFTFGEGCGLCNSYYEELQKHGCDWTIVDLELDDQEWAFTKLLITGFPCTKVYIDDIVVYNKGGVLYSTQIRKAKETYEKFNGN